MKKIIAKFALAALLIMPLGVALPAGAAAPNWNVTGTWDLDFDLGGGHYLHTMTVTSFDPTTGAFSGKGIYTDPSYTWTVTGTVDGNNITYHILYTGANSGYTVDAVGVITSATSMSGSWSNTSQSGTWTGVRTATSVVDTCPAGTNPVFLETKTVPANSSVATQSSILPSGNYLLVSSSDWANRNNTNQMADAEYATMDGWGTWMNGYNFPDYQLGEGEFDLQVDGAFINWGNYNPAHEYFHLYTGTGNPVSLLVFDGDSNNTGQINPGWYGDNSGNLTVNIYACNPIVHTITASAGTNGFISPSGSVSVNDGNNQSFTITANSGFQVADVVVDNVSQGAMTSYDFTNVTANHTISASFSIVLIGPPTDKDKCKKDGWRTFNNPTFKNQGDCVSFVASKGKAKGNP